MSDRILGTDCSFWQDNDDTSRAIDFRKMKSSGAEFVILRAGQNKWQDEDFSRYWKDSKGILPRGSYWFFDSRVDPKTQAQLWVNALGDDLGELPMWCDFEDTYRGAYHGWKQWYNFMVEIQRLLPDKQIGVYTGYYFWIENTLQVGIPSISLQWFAQFPLWIANYNVGSPLIPRPWSTWELWQFTDAGDGTKYGVESLNIDLNYFNGTIEDFRIRYNLTDQPKRTGSRLLAEFENETVQYKESSQ